MQIGGAGAARPMQTKRMIGLDRDEKKTTEPRQAGPAQDGFVT